MITCTQCGADKPSSDFHASEIRKGGLTGRCRLCLNARTRAVAKANGSQATTFSRDEVKWMHALHMQCLRMPAMHKAMTGSVAASVMRKVQGMSDRSDAAVNGTASVTPIRRKQ